MSDVSARFGITEPSADRHDAADVPLYVRNVVAGMEALAAMFGQGTLASRPAAAKQGRFYMATDQTPQLLFYDTGSSWIQVGSLAAGGVGTTQLADNSVTNPKMADDSVGSAEIIADSVGSAEIAPQGVTAVELANALKPSSGAGGSTEALRALGTAAGQAAAGIHAPQHAAGGADPITVTAAMLDSATSALVFQPGDIKMVGYDVVAGTNEPAGWLLADGRSVAYNTYPALGAKLGGSPGGNVTLPDSRSRSPMGKGQGSGLSLRSVGQTFGAETHTLDVSQMPAHAHTGTAAAHSHGIPALSLSINTGGAHNHVPLGNAAGNYFLTQFGGSQRYTSGTAGTGIWGDTVTETGGAHTHTGATVASNTNASGTLTVTLNNTGGGGSHPNVHPCFVCSFLIKT